MVKFISSSRLLTVTAIAAIYAFIAASFVMGIERRMDQKIGFGPLNEAWHLSIAISNIFYGLEGYVGFYKVYQTIQYGLGIKDFYASGADAPDIVSITNGTKINEALEKASKLDQLEGLGPTFPRTLEAYRDGLSTVEGSNLISPIGEDLGTSKFFAWSFRLFGLRIQSVYYFFYLLLTASVTVFLLQFWRKPIALSALLANVFAFHAFFYFPFFSPFMPTIYINRFSSTLCVIAVWHLMFLLVQRHRWSLGPFILATLQLLLLLFGVFIRSSANWVFLAIFALWGLIFFRDVLSQRCSALFARARGAFASAKSWPLLLAVAGVVLLNIYISIVPNPIFRSGGNQPHHMRWHSLWVGLSFHPDWHRYFPDLPAHSDDTAQKLTLKIWVDAGHTPESFNFPYTRIMNIGLHEALIRKEFLRFVSEHPRYFLESVFYYKPILLYNLIKQMYVGSDVSILMPLAATIILIVCLIAFCEIAAACAMLAIGSLLWLCSVMPILLVYPAEHVMADQIWNTTVFLVGLSAVLVSFLVRAAAKIAGFKLLSVSESGQLPRHTSRTILAASVVVWLLVGGLAVRAAMPTIYILDAHWGCKEAIPEAEFMNGTVVHLTLAKRACEGHRSCSYNAFEGPTTLACKRQMVTTWQCGLNGPVTNNTWNLNDTKGGFDVSLSCSK